MLSQALESEVAQRDQVQTQVDALAPDVAHFEARKEQEQEVSCKPGREPRTVTADRQRV